MKHITVFGSSRCVKGDQEYIFAESIGSMLGKLGLNVATGGYQGTMEAISKGASKHAVSVIGVTVPSLFSNMSKDSLTEQIGVRFYKSDIQKIHEKARKERVNLSAYVRKIVSIAIEEQ